MSNGGTIYLSDMTDGGKDVFLVLKNTHHASGLNVGGWLLG
jgi:hypothetical protein